MRGNFVAQAALLGMLLAACGENSGTKSTAWAKVEDDHPDLPGIGYTCEAIYQAKSVSEGGPEPSYIAISYFSSRDGSNKVYTLSVRVPKPDYDYEKALESIRKSCLHRMGPTNAQALCDELEPELHSIVKLNDLFFDTEIFEDPSNPNSKWEWSMDTAVAASEFESQSGVATYGYLFGLRNEYEVEAKQALVRLTKKRELTLVDLSYGAELARECFEAEEAAR